MENRYLDVFATASINTFNTMCGIAVRQDGACYRKEGVFPTHETVAIMGFSGAVRGAVIMTMPVPVAQGLVGAFIGEAVTQVSADLTDGLGEILNIIAGAATSEMADLKLRISLPTVLVGKEQRLATKQNAPWFVIPLEAPGLGKLNLQLSVVDA